jgi:hypothetical protein
MAGPKGVYVYHSDDTNAYNVAMDSGNATAAGFSAASAGALPNKPRSMKMRHIQAQHPTTGRERQIAIPSASSSLYVGGTGTITIEDFTTSPSDDVAYVIKGRIGERRLAR